MYFSFDFGWYSIHLDIVHEEQGCEWRGFCLTDKICYRCTLLRQFLATESPLKMMKDAFYFNLKALFVLKICTSLSCFFVNVEKLA